MEKCELSKRKLFLKAWIILCMLLNAVMPQSADEGLSTCEVEALVRELINPSQEYQMHVTALRNQLRNLLDVQRITDFQNLDPTDIDENNSDKRSIASLARYGVLSNGKRYVGSVARSGGLRTDLDFIKRSIATLAKNGQLPSREPDLNESTQQWNDKRNLGSAARSGYLNGKRNVGSLARDFQLPNGKRNLASLIRLGVKPSLPPKRNMASIARNSNLPLYNTKRETGNSLWFSFDPNNYSKRNIGALKNSPVHGTRQKRDILRNLGGDESFEVADPVEQNPQLDYDELKEMLSHVYSLYYGGNTHEEKRFLGRILPPTRATSTTHRGRL